MFDKILNIGHSPDADDAFMFYAIFNKKIKVDFLYQENIQEIQHLNQDASEKKLDFTAASVYAYIHNLHENYDILSAGASVGDKYGPLIVSKKKFLLKELKNLKIAIPGNKTTSYLLMKYFESKKDLFFEEKFYPFNEVIEALNKDEVDLAIVIHERQINYTNLGLYKVVDLGEFWYQEENMVIPLGINIVLKNLDSSLKKYLNQILKESIEYALNNKLEALEYAKKYSRGILPNQLLKFITMYVNHYTINLGENGKKAIYRLYEVAKDLKLIKDKNLNFKFIE